MEKSDKIRVEVAYAVPQKQRIIALDVARGATLEEAIEQSGILEAFPNIDLSQSKAGIFGKLHKMKDPLRAGDRIEIYRPLIADPKAVRKERAAQGKKMKKGGSS